MLQTTPELTLECRPRHRFLEPIHNVKDGALCSYRGEPRIRFLHSWKVLVATTPPRRQWWWSQSGSNRRPQACKASALPTELWPHWIKPFAMVGRVGVEPTTSRL